MRRLRPAPPKRRRFVRVCFAPLHSARGAPPPPCGGARARARIVAVSRSTASRSISQARSKSRRLTRSTLDESRRARVARAVEPQRGFAERRAFFSDATALSRLQPCTSSWVMNTSNAPSSTTHDRAVRLRAFAPHELVFCVRLAERARRVEAAERRSLFVLLRGGRSSRGGRLGEPGERGVPQPRGGGVRLQRVRHRARATRRRGARPGARRAPPPRVSAGPQPVVRARRRAFPPAFVLLARVTRATFATHRSPEEREHELPRPRGVPRARRPRVVRQRAPLVKHVLRRVVRRAARRQRR